MVNYSLVNNIHSFPMKFKRVVLGCDFAYSANVGADWSVFTSIGVDYRNHYWILNISRVKGKTYNEQLAIIRQLHANFKYQSIYMESNGMQSIFVDGSKELDLPVTGVTTGINKYSLNSGLPGITVIMEQGRLHFPRKDAHSIDVGDEWEKEFGSISWTDKQKLAGVGAHDDYVMSTWIALKAANDGANFDFAFF
jgi:hypothetical protein